MDIRSLAENQESAYTDFLRKNPRSLLFCSLPYKKLIEQHLNCDAEYLLYYAGDCIAGAFPLMFSRESRLGRVANSLPFYGSNGGILVNPELGPDMQLEVWTSLLEAGNSLIKAKKCVASTIISSPFDEHLDWYREYCHADFKDERIGQITFMPEKSANTADELMTAYHQKTRNMVRKAAKSNLSIKQTSAPEAIDFLYRIHVENMEQIGGLSKKQDFFTRIPDFFKENEYKVFTAYLDEKPVAALLMFYFNRTAEYFTPVIINEYRDLQPMSLLIYEAMQDAVANGFRYWNWGGTWKTQDGVYRFKNRWNATDINYEYFIRCYDDNLKSASSGDLLKEFPGFYVLPFGCLTGKNETNGK